MDYDKLCALLGRTWAYITPAHFYEEMDMYDIQKLAPFLDGRDYAACFGRRSENLDQAARDGVIRRK